MTTRNHFLAGCTAVIALLSAGFVAGTASAQEGTAAEKHDSATGIIIAPRNAPARFEQFASLQQEDAPADGDLPLIVPRGSAAADEDAAEPAEDAAGTNEAQSKAASYRELFESIPFSRAEFAANPSYRHDAVMELLTGNARPPRLQIIQSAPAPPVPHYLPNLPVMRHYFDMSRGPYSRYQSLFGYRGGYRPLFYH